MKWNEPIVNRIIDNTITSNLVYPLEKGFYYVVQIDKNWIEERLFMLTGVKNTDISNKYAVVLIANTGNDIIVYNHDGTYWLIDKPKETVKEEVPIDKTFSIVRNNLLTVPDYKPYCGSNKKCNMLRTEFDGQQFVCPICGWCSSFEYSFIKEYIEKWNIK